MIPPPAAPRPFEFPPVHKHVLANGLTTYFVEDHRLPLVSFSIEVLAGSSKTPATRAGLANLAAGLLREGTAAHSAEQIARLVDNAGGTLGASANEDTASAGGTFLKSTSDLGLGLLADMIQQPAFAEEEIERQVRQLESSLAVRYSDPDFLADTALWRAVFGTHPYAYPSEGTPVSLRGLTRSDFLAFHRRNYLPSSAWLALAGDLTPDQAFAKAEHFFGPWSGHPLPAVPLPAPISPPPGVLIIDLPNSVQAQIRVGHLSVPRNHLDSLALIIGDQIFGGSFNSRVNMKLRAHEGLTYGASSRFDFFREAGTLGVSTFTRTGKTAEAVRFILDLFEEWSAHPASEEEFTESRQFLLGRFGLSVETPGAVASRVLGAVVYGLGDDYWKNYPGTLGALTLETVAGAVRRHIEPARLQIVCAGQASEIAGPLEVFGPVTVIPAAEFNPLAAGMRRADA